MRIEEKPEVPKPIKTKDAQVSYFYELDEKGIMDAMLYPSQKYYSQVKIKSTLEDISPNSYVYRVKVIGGWIVMKYHHGMVFIEDPNHLWEIDK